MAYAFSTLRIPAEYLKIWSWEDFLDYLEYANKNNSKDRTNKEEYITDEDIARF